MRKQVVWAVDVSDDTMPILLRLLADRDPEVAADAWEVLSREMGEVPYPSAPTSAAEGREMAKAYDKAWKARGHKPNEGNE